MTADNYRRYLIRDNLSPMIIAKDFFVKNEIHISDLVANARNQLNPTGSQWIVQSLPMDWIVLIERLKLLKAFEL